MLTKEEYHTRVESLQKARQQVEDRYSFNWQGPLSGVGTALEDYATTHGNTAFDSLRLHAAYASHALRRLQQELGVNKSPNSENEGLH